MPLAPYFAALALALPLAWASPAAALEAGKDYTVLPQKQPTESRNKIEVVEFFAYTCPHCFELEPELNAWARKLPKNVVLKRQPVVFSDGWEPMARAYFALEALGALPRLHGDVFNALHLEGLPLNESEAFFDWAAKHGLDRAKLKAAYNSFATSAKIAQAKRMQSAYKINGVPALAVNGKYVTSGGLTGSNERSLEVVRELIRMESRRSGAAAR